jgi:uncharacterized membrane protein
MATAQAPVRTNRLPRTRAQPRRQAPATNVGEMERWLSLLGGGALALVGLSRGSLGGLGLAAVGAGLAYRGASGHCNVYAALGVSTAEGRGRRTSIPAGHGIKVEESVTILRSPEELYGYWANLENLPRIMNHLVSVRKLDGQRSHWVACGPLGTHLEWDAEILVQRENELISWRSLDGAEVDTAGSVHFTAAPGDRGTLVRVVLKYDPPAGKVGAAIAGLLGQAPGQTIKEDLRRFKQLMETGEIPTTEGQPRGTCAHSR